MSKSRLSFIEAIDRAKEQISRIPELDRQRIEALYRHRYKVPTPMRDVPRIVRVERSTKAHLVGNWYTDLIGSEFSVLMFSITANEYTVWHDDEYRILRAEDVETVSG